MPANTEQLYDGFISKLSDDFNQKFTYTKETFVNCQTPMSIICRNHQETFQQRPDTHLRGAIKCSGCKKDKKVSISIEEYKASLPEEISKRFIYKSKQLINIKTTPIEIQCIEHKYAFFQRADTHKKGMIGCKECRRIKQNKTNQTVIKKLPKRYTELEYIDECKKVHGDKYDYSGTKYTRSKERVNVKCPKHGIFSPVAQCHLVGDGCKKCANERLSLLNFKKIEEFINQANDAWKEKNKELFDYTNSIYNGRHSPINIRCKIHNTEFIQDAGAHLQKHTGCKECKKISIQGKLITPIDIRITESRKVHGDRYEYDLTSYVNGKIPMRIKCPDHGWFLQKMFKHIHAKQGCPTCSWSIGSKMLYTLMQKHFSSKIIDRFETEYTGFDIIYKKPMRCDYVVWINDKPLVIEFDHKQHFEKQDHFHQDTEFITQKLRDIKKNHDLLEKGISILRIHWGDIEFLENILLSTYKRELNAKNASIYFSNPIAYKKIWFS